MHPPVLESDDFKRYENFGKPYWQDPKVGIGFHEDRQVERIYISSYWRCRWLDELRRLCVLLDEMCNRNINRSEMVEAESTGKLRLLIEQAEINEKLWCDF